MNKWNGWYDKVDKLKGTFEYGNTVTYDKAAEYLQTCNIVEDWGCGGCFFKNKCKTTYIGVDGSNTPFADKKVELLNYTSNVDGILLRHVLEHNYEWKKILDNALKSFNKRMCLVLFTPLSTETKEIAHNRHVGVDVPDLSFSLKDIDSVIKHYGNIQYSFEIFNTETQYKIETIFYIEKV